MTWLARMELLREHPLIDCHNDLLWRCACSDISGDTTGIAHTDLPRPMAGMVGGQFRSVLVPSTLRGGEL
ncbi:hypothetical protein HCN51_47960 [Nonomuraea sp. FMUSA5-5]|uniref:Membrane dipeptidase n=1 Tax=Nonomuraea composti TaxID=2720023 RepID=A0ABX1BH62_9ACTN|nr:membrane dipeptidase [Nonomuraea sp. FMUSA5-5]NJP97080.1 hypothetical protein [Nonomuraea sp. FMUSA5-5]